jgi:hypothetical protein
MAQLLDLLCGNRNLRQAAQFQESGQTRGILLISLRLRASDDGETISIDHDNLADTIFDLAVEVETVSRCFNCKSIYLPQATLETSKSPMIQRKCLGVSFIIFCEKANNEIGFVKINSDVTHSEPPVNIGRRPMRIEAPV